MIGSYIAFGLSMIGDMRQRNQEKLDEITEEWFRSASYPRKKKKKVRKRLLVEWQIFSYASEMLKI